MGDKPARRTAHQNFLKRLRDEHEKRTGHTPDEATSRQLERNAEEHANKYDWKKSR